MRKSFKEEKGFYYEVKKEVIREYTKWKPEKRLAWLKFGNLLQKELPKEIQKLHQKFREGKI